MVQAKIALKTVRQRSQERRYELVAFLTGFSLLVLEITGGRLIAPFFGTSIYIWTATIGVILGALAVGTVIGGQKADAGQPVKIIRNTALMAAIAVAIMGIVQQPILATLAGANLDLRVSATLAALLLFALPSYLIGVVGPNLAKLNVTSLEVAGRSVGRIEAASTIGSIAGTFMTGYFFLGWFGSRSIVIGVAVVLLLVSLLIGHTVKRVERERTAADATKLWLALSLLLAAALTGTSNTAAVLADIDTSYARYTVFSAQINNTPIRALATDGLAYQSGVSVTDPTQPVFSYIQNFYQTARVLDPASVLVVGGGSFTFPTVLDANADSTALQRIDVVEIDPELTTIAKDYFFFKDTPRINIINQDGRKYLNDTTVKYDTVYMDAFSSLSPPFQLTTQEAVAQVARSLTADGVAVINVIGNYNDGNGEYLRAVTATYRTSFKHVVLYQSDPENVLGGRQNFIILASNNESVITGLQIAFLSEPLTLRSGGLMLTDNYAPVERLTY